MELQPLDANLDQRCNRSYQDNCIAPVCCTDEDVKAALRNLGPRVVTVLLSPVDEEHVKRVALSLVKEGLSFRIIASPLVRVLSFYGLDKNNRIIKRRRWRYGEKVGSEAEARLTVRRHDKYPRLVRPFKITPRQALMMREE